MKDILGTLAAHGSFTTLLSLLEQTPLPGRLSEAGPFTLFAPNDRAFERINLEEIGRDRNYLVSLLAYHLLAGEYGSSDIAKERHLLTESGKSLSVSTREGRPVIDNASFVATDIRCSNGVIHVIDNVFLPQFSGWYCGGC